MAAGTKGRLVATCKLQQWPLQPNKKKSLIRGADHGDERNANYKAIMTLENLHPAGYIHPTTGHEGPERE